MKDITVKCFRSVKEHSEPEIGKIIGEIPEWLHGALIRNGPARWDLKSPHQNEIFHMNHIFDGYNLLTKFQIRPSEGIVKYSSKFLQSEAFKKADAVGKPIISEYGTRPGSVDSKKSLFARMISTLIPEQTDNCPFICSTLMGRNPIAIGDTGYMFEVDKETLECVARFDPIKDLGVHSLTSHPLVDQETGYTYNIGVSLFSGARWNVLKFPESKSVRESVKKAQVLTSFPCRNKTYIPWNHSFGMTKNYIIIIDQPSYFNATKLIGSLFAKGVCPKDLNEWKPEMKNQFYVIHKATGKVVNVKETLSKEAFFFYHILNCFEVDRHVVVYVYALPNFKSVENLTINNVRGGFKVRDQDSPKLHCYVIPLMDDFKTRPENVNLISGFSEAQAYKLDGKMYLEPHILTDVSMEASSYNTNFSGQKINHLWATGSFAPTNNHHKIFKLSNLQNDERELVTWHASENQFVGESLFVPMPDADSEDEGVIINCVANYTEHDNAEKDYVLFLNAETLEEYGRAYFNEIPIAFHSTFISE